MSPSAAASSSSSNLRSLVAAELRAVAASWRAKSVERLRTAGLGGYLLLWMLQPVFQLSIAALIYERARPELVDYAVVAIAAQSLIFTTIFYVGEILDNERMNGTLVALFLAPCARVGWLTGFALVGLLETLLMATATLAFGRVILGVRFDPNLPALLLTLALFVLALSGLGFVFSAVGLALRKANPLSNIVYPFAILLGGVYFPVALLPDWLRYPARALPLGYGTEALAAAALDHAGIVDLAPKMLPLAGFALALPVAGVLTFRWLERSVRERGELELY
jgi:ABC-2 type transport system permease protein